VLKVLLPLAVALGLIFWVAHVTIGALVCAAAVVYFASLYAHPNRDCISCHGHKAHGPEGSANFRKCWTCKGKGHYPRLGVRLLRRDVIEGRKAGKRGRSW
jgi:hypothetical protein